MGGFHAIGGIIDVELRKVVEELHADLKKWQKSNSRVACVMVFLTIAMLALVGFQIYLEFFKT